VTAEETQRLLLRNGTVLDVESGRYVEADVRCDAGRIVEIGPGLKVGGEVPVVDLDGATVLPGLIDAHVHLTAATADLAGLTSWSPVYVTAHATRIMAGMLERGFTTVRDASGAEYGLAAAQAEGLIRGPRVFFCGRALTQTGGHGDMRGRGEQVWDHHPTCAGMDRIADGVDAVRTAARDELRKGAHHLKVHASGGVASPTDRIDSTQYSLPELVAVVEEAEAANRYVAAHAYTAKAVSRALVAGIRTIEHGNLIDESNVAEFLERDAYLVPTLVTYWAMHRDGIANGLPEASWRKGEQVLEAGLSALELAHRGGVRIAFGTDLLGGLHRLQKEEFRIRREVQQPLDIVRSATTTAAALLRREGELGVVAVGALADLLVLDGDPLSDITVLTEAKHLRYVVQGGTVVHRRP